MLADLIDYQEGSVASRTIVNKEAGTVTLFAFDECQVLSKHTAPFDVLVYGLDGEIEVTISGKAVQLKKRRNDNNARQQAPRAEGNKAVQDASDND